MVFLHHLPIYLSFQIRSILNVSMFYFGIAYIIREYHIFVNIYDIYVIYSSYYSAEYLGNSYWLLQKQPGSGAFKFKWWSILNANWYFHSIVDLYLKRNPILWIILK